MLSISSWRRVEGWPDGPSDYMGREAQDKWQAELEGQIKEIEESTVTPEEIPGLKVHLCSLVAPDSPAGQPWTPVYVHSKLMIVNDVFTTHGSANINTRSMQADSELNIAHEWASETQKLRRRLWDLHTGGEGMQDEPEKAFSAWQELVDKNKRHHKAKRSPQHSLAEFYYGKAVMKDLD